MRDGAGCEWHQFFKNIFILKTKCLLSTELFLNSLQCDFLKYFQTEVSPSASQSKKINNSVLAPLGLHSQSIILETLEKMYCVTEVAAFKCLLSLGVKTNRRRGICLFVLVGYEKEHRSRVMAD